MHPFYDRVMIIYGESLQGAADNLTLITVLLWATITGLRRWLFRKFDQVSALLNKKISRLKDREAFLFWASGTERCNPGRLAKTNIHQEIFCREQVYGVGENSHGYSVQKEDLIN